ncbi:MAG: hypothetical protein IKG18_10520 [Atopobiaceae bacterium]|nr:hypothetical protein [Atopobiaceae bacterium]
MARRNRNKRDPLPKQRQQSTPTATTIVPLQLDSSVKAYELTIALKSDLCSGSGDGFSSGIDTDVCYDTKGIPIIPGRRIKGCLREAALDIYPECDDLINLVFGTSGSGTGGLVTV